MNIQDPDSHAFCKGGNGERSGSHHKTFRLIGIILLAIVIVVMAKVPSLAQSQIHRVGVLTPGATFAPVLLGFQEGLSRLGYKGGQNITFQVEDTKGYTGDLALRMEKLLAAKPDMLFTVATAQSVAAKQATSTIPIVFAWVADPIQTHLIASYASSNSNVTGISVSSDSLSGKRLEALLEIAPKVKRLLAIVATKEEIAQTSFQFLQETAKRLGVNVLRRDATTEEEIKQALQETPKGSVDAIYHVPSSFVGANVGLLIEKAKQDKIPLVAHEDSIAARGALLSYGPDFRSVGLQSARLAAKILKGERPSDIPSETPERLLLVLNLGTAKAIGLKIRREVLERADRLVE